MVDYTTVEGDRMTQKPEPDLIFFLGAGASVKAGVPDTYKLVTAFQDEIKGDSTLEPTTQKIIDLLVEWRKNTKQPDDRIDVELLLETLERLKSRDTDFLLRFYDNPRYLLKDEPEKSRIIERLRDFIKTKAIVDQESVSYVQPMLTFVREYSPLDIFTVNYDTLVEQFSTVYKLELSDGFESRWDSNAFKRSKDIRLYKLHGSITWYKTDHGDYVKVPILARVDEIELVTKEKARSLILYPMRKWDYDEPLLELLVMLKHRLETARFCIIVGYSFRDEHITRIFWDAARSNRELHLIFIGPHSRQVYETKLQYYESPVPPKIPSSLKGRVVCLPYRFEDIFAEVREILRNLNNGLRLEEDARTQEMYRGRPDWMNIVKVFVEAEHIDKVKELQTRIEWDFLPPALWIDRLQVSFKAWFLAMTRQDTGLSQLWESRLQRALSSIDTTTLRTVADNNVVALAFDVSPSVRVGAKQLFDVMAPLIGLTKSRAKMFGGTTGKKVEELASVLEKIILYLVAWGDGNIAARSYIQMRESIDKMNVGIFSEALGMLTGTQKSEGTPVKMLEDSSGKIEVKIWQDLMISLRRAIS
jgi:hypothetical protein